MKCTLSPQWIALFSLGLALNLLGCGKPQPTEQPSSKSASANPTTPKPTNPEPTTRPGKELTATGPAVLTLCANGAFLDPDGKAVDSKEEVEPFLKQERARLKEPRTIFRAEKETDIVRVRNALALYRKAGFHEIELQEAANTAKKGPILTLREPPKIDIDPNKPSDADLSLPAQMTVVVHANSTGSQAGQVRDVIFKTASGEMGFPRGKWREGLSKAIRGLIEGQDITNKDDCEIQADTHLTYGAVLEVIELCSSAGLKRIELSLLGGKRPKG